jgi:tetratricopeptide (TPR) repeat protein
LKTHILFRLFISLLLVAVAAGGCKTTKRRGDLSKLGKFYHNTTAEYNGYFNADVLLFESTLELENQHQDNYNQILPLYKYRAAGNPKAVAQNLDRAIEKLSVVVALHRYSDWTDDCYLLIGKSQYLKQDFESAEETLEYMIAEYKPSTLKAGSSKSTTVKKKKSSSKKKKKKPSSKKKKKKKRKPVRKPASRRPAPSPEKTVDAEGQEEEAQPVREMISIGSNQVEIEEGKPESYFLRHRPAYQEGLLWLARTYVERGNYFEADRIIYQLTRSASTFKDIRRELAVVEAYYYLQQKRYADAIAPLERAVTLEKDRLLKARYSYILAQLYERLGNEDAALQAFQAVTKFRPSYEMDFSARLNMTKMTWATGRTPADEVRKDLDRMLKDLKNVDYLDQIYFVLAEIDLAEGKRDQAIAHLRSSLAKSTGNAAQKAEAYLTLAYLYFEDEQFVPTKKYLDSTLTLLPPTDERYSDVNSLAGNLTEIAKNLETIQLQDSLIAMSKLTQEERFALATEIKKQQDEARRKALLESSKEEAVGPGGRPGGLPVTGAPRAGGVKSDFFAYDDRSVKRGVRDFERIWGNRPLEDNWRLSTGASGIAVGEEAEQAEEVVSAALTEEDVKAIFRDVPQTPEDLEEAHEAIQKAFFSLGRLYREKLENEQRAIEALETLLSRYPDTQYRPETLYLLYLAYKDTGRTADAKRCYDLLTGEFPESPYALLLTDPEYLQKTLDREAKVNKYYDAVLADFRQGRYQAAYEQIQKVPAMFGGNNSHTPRFELLKAMCLGNMQGKDAYVGALREFIETFPDVPEQKQAREILRLLGEYTATGPAGASLKPQEETYVFEPDDKHYIIVVFQGNITLEKAKVQIADYHLKYHKLDKLRVSNIYLGDIENRTPIIVVRSFDDRFKAQEYAQGVQANQGDFVSGEFPYQVFPISQNNYRQMLKNKVVDGYPEFYQKNY